MTDPASLQAAIQRAGALARAGRAEDAVAAYRAVLDRQPDLPDVWYDLARQQRRAGRPEAALESYAQALARGASGPEEIHLNRGVIYADDLRREADAERELKTALRLNPAYAPAMLNLGNLEEDRGEREAAAALYAQVLEIAPDHFEALARLAGVTRFAGADDTLIARLRAAMADGRADVWDKANLGFALGRALDSCGAYDEAFGAYAAANRFSRAAAPPNLRYDPRAQELAVDRLIETFHPGMFASPVPGREPAPVFICGMYRSGSTLAEQAMASHSRVTAGGELPFLPGLIRTDVSPFPAAARGISAERLTALADRYRAQVRSVFPRADLVTDKNPPNFLYIGLIKLLFPDARIVHTVREPMDTGLSIFFLHLDPRLTYASDLGDIGHYFAQYRRLMAHWRSLFGADILDFDYDALVRDPEPALRRLTGFCGLEWEPGCLEFHRAKGSVKTASVWQVREPLYTRSSGRWRNYEAHLGPLRKALGGA